MNIARKQPPRRAPWFRSGAGAALFFALLALGRPVAGAHARQAHPSDEGRVETVFKVQNGRLVYSQDWWLGNLVGLRFWTEHIDADKDLHLSDSERDAFKQYALGWATLDVDGAPVAPRLDALEIADYAAFVSLPTAPQIHLEYSVPLTRGDFTLVYRRAKLDGYFFNTRFPAGGGVKIENQQLQKDVFAATVTSRAGESPAVAAPTNTPARLPATAVRGLVLVAVFAAFGIAALALIAMISLLRRRKKDT